MSLYLTHLFLTPRRDGKLAVHDQGGFVPTHEEVEEVIAGIRAWYAGLSAEAIADNNNELNEKYFGHKPKVLQPKPEPVPKPGYVYLLRCGPHYKIGRTKHLSNRISGIGAKLPFEPEVIATCRVDDMVKTESGLHAMFAHKRLNGEWFDLTDDEVQRIRHLLED